ncbi:MAG: phosphonate metabolism protein/1,5-bisphosphokinase (PRPP-forming) PhnN [Burkholderiaceae bacterium]|nr:phosphonate metabolism protein/1,5-bisphosphokinase (PRPP-forming) PhnN [Burkholderiaceae bacterium]
MNTRLIYVCGPSGAGKDTLLQWLRQHLPHGLPLHWARRTISRPATADAEEYEGVTPEAFTTLSEQGAFGLQWEANRLHYGIRQGELAALARGDWVVVNGSRAHLPQAAAQYPGLVAVHLTASADTLRQRLHARGRETPEVIEERVRRAVAFTPPAGSTALEVRNDSTVDAAGQALLAGLRTLPGWPEGLPPHG